MKIGVLCDIHGNLPTLEAVLHVFDESGCAMRPSGRECTDDQAGVDGAGLCRGRAQNPSVGFTYRPPSDPQNYRKQNT